MKPSPRPAAGLSAAGGMEPGSFTTDVRGRAAGDLFTMLPKRFLHYEVLEKLCTTGLSEIYKVKNLKLAGRVEVLKLLSEQHRRNKDLYQRFRREAEVLSSLNHRSIPVVYEINAFRNRPFLTMEYVEGKSLLDITEYNILSVGRVVTVGLEVAEGLRAAHARGVVHRDLKLSNLMITRDGRVKIIDFGLAATDWTAPPEDRGVIIGTLPYLSPEQAEGERVDHRTDIFSLGICLYELLTGRLPFFDPDPEEVLRKVREEQPRPIRQFRPETPERLEQCIFRCIEKDRRRRYAHMDEVLRALEDTAAYLRDRGEDRVARPLSRERMETLSLDMVAREEPYARVARAYFQALAGRGTTLFVEGEAGIGKTRLVEELLKQVDPHRVYVASGQAQPGMPLPYRPVADALRYFLLSHKAVTDEEVAEFIDVECGTGTFHATLLKSILLRIPSREMEIATRENLFDAVSAFLARVASRAPLVLVLENLHWADGATLDLVLHLTAAVQGRRILLIATYRPDEGAGRSPSSPGARLREAAQGAEQAETGERIRLERLNEEETRSLVNFYFPGNTFSKGFHRRIHGSSDGNPLFVLELLKLFERLGRVCRRRGKWIVAENEEEFPVPTRIHDLLSRKLEALDETETRVLEAAAVEGVSFTSEAVGLLTGLDRLAVLNMLRTLWSRGLIDLKGEVYRFNPSLVREVVYRRMLPELRRTYHGLLARRGAESPDARTAGPLETARHFQRAGESAEAIRYFVKAGNSALGLHADREALESFDRALALLEESPLGSGAATAMPIHVKRAEILIRLGAPERAAEAATEALTLAEAGGSEEEVGRALMVKGKVAHIRGNTTEAHASLEEALRRCTAPEDRAEILNLLGLEAENRGDHHEAMDRFSEALALSEAAGNPLRTAQTLNHMGRTFLNQGEPQEALPRFRKALRITAALGDRRGVAVNTNNLGILLRRMDRLHDALRLLFRAARIFQEIRYPEGAAHALWNLSQVYLALGERAKAEKYARKALRIFQRIDAGRSAALCRLTLASIAAAGGEVGIALEQLERALEAGEALGDPRLEAYGLMHRGWLELQLGLLEQSKERLESAADAARRYGDRSLEATAQAHLGLALCMDGSPAAGVPALEKAAAGARAGRDPGTRLQVCLLHCRGAILTGALTEAETDLREASAHVARTARPSRKAELYHLSGLVELHRNRPARAKRKLETALSLYRRLDEPLKRIQVIHDLARAALATRAPENVRRGLERERMHLVERVGRSLHNAEARAAFERHYGPSERTGRGEGVP